MAGLLDRFVIHVLIRTYRIRAQIKNIQIELTSDMPSDPVLGQLSHRIRGSLVCIFGFPFTHLNTVIMHISEIMFS